jgi:hypothetical protein
VQENEGASGDVHENNGRGKIVRAEYGGRPSDNVGASNAREKRNMKG